MGRDLTEAVEKRARMDESDPGWRDKKYENGNLMFAPDGTMLDSDGSGRRSIFDDIDC